MGPHSFCIVGEDSIMCINGHMRMIAALADNLLYEVVDIFNKEYVNHGSYL